MVILLMAVMVISILDKTIFAFAGVQIMAELQLTPEQFGFVGSAFFFFYSLSGVLVGFLANRFPTRWILLGMSLVWMTAQLLVTLTSSLAALTASRLLLGAGTGPGTAVTQHACFKWFGPQERVLPASLIQVSIMLGGVIAAIVLPFSIEHFGWRLAYLTLAGLSLLWAAAWLLLGAEGQQAEHGPSAVAEQPRPYRQLLLNRSFLWISLMCFLAYTPNSLAFSWMVVYLQKGLGLSPMHSGYAMLVATLGIIAANLLVSSVAQRSLQRGASLWWTMVLPPMACCMVGGAALGLFGALDLGLAGKLGFYLLGAVLLNTVFAFGMTITAHITPACQRGAMLAIHVGSLTLSGMLAPWLVGKAISLLNNDIARGFELTVAGYGAVTLVCALLGLYLINPQATRQRLQALGRNAPSEQTPTSRAAPQSS